MIVIKSTHCTIIMYHYVRNLKQSRYPEIKELDESLFVEQLDFLQNEFNIITMEQLLSVIAGEGEIPPNAALLTFDDGYIDHYTTVFPHLYNRKLQGSFFVPAAVVSEHRVLDVNKIHFILANTDTSKILNEIYSLLGELRRDNLIAESDSELRERLIEPSRFDTPDVVFIKSLLQHGIDEALRNRITDKLFKKFVSCDENSFSCELYMNLEQIKLMKDCGMFFGLHGYDHYWLGKLDEKLMRNDILKALDYWGDIIDRHNWVMNYPYGSYNQNVVDFLETQGCKLGLTTNVAIAKIEYGNRLELPRLDTNDFPPKSRKYLEIR